MNILNLIFKGYNNMQAEATATEATKVGTLRAGNTGVVTFDGKVAGNCHRRTYLRYKGIEVDDGQAERELMFEAGRTNEDSWVKLLLAAKEPGLIIKREEEIAIGWSIEDAQDKTINVTGRPDIVLGQNDSTGKFVPSLGLELKQVSAVNTAISVGIKLEPKLAHLMQAAHYMWQLNVPFELWYTSRVDWAITGWAEKKLPDKIHEEVDSILVKNFRKQPIKILPFIQGYQLKFNDKQQLMYRPIFQSGNEVAWTHTLVTIDGIKEYFKTVANIDSTDSLGKRPLTLTTTGEKESWNHCQYCPLQTVCDKYEDKGAKVWTSEVVKFQQKSAKEKSTNNR